jgi:hypothetical protein
VDRLNVATLRASTSSFKSADAWGSLISCVDDDANGPGLRVSRCG